MLDGTNRKDSRCVEGGAISKDSEKKNGEE